MHYEEKLSSIDKEFEITKRATKLSYNTVKKWTKDKTTLPVDLHYDITEFSKLVLYSNSLI